jgi:hypothetical protein
MSEIHFILLSPQGTKQLDKGSRTEYAARKKTDGTVLDQNSQLQKLTASVGTWSPTFLVVTLSPDTAPLSETM